MLDDGWTDRWMNPGQSHLLAPDPGHGKEAPWWQVWAQEGLWLTALWVWGRQWHPPHGLAVSAWIWLLAPPLPAV